MIHKIAVEFDTETGKVDVKAESNETPDQVLSILETVRRNLRKQLGVHEVIAQFSPATQSSVMSFDSEEIKTWGYVATILGLAKEAAEFNEWFGKFVNANNQMSHAAQQAAVNQHIKSKLHL